jgi:hypothetical protein
VEIRYDAEKEFKYENEKRYDDVNLILPDGGFEFGIVIKLVVVGI